MRINRQDTNGVKPLLAVGELGYDNYPTGGDAGRVYVGTGATNISLAKKSEVTVVDSKADTHIARVDNPHSVTKTQVGLANVDNTADANKNVLSATKLTTARNITLSGDVTGTASFNGSADASITTIVADNSHLHTIANVTGLQTALDNKVDDTEKGSVNGVATLDANGKVTLTQIPDSVLGQLEYQGVWDFTTLPTATQKGQYWIASVSGNGYVVGDWAVWNGVTFDKVDNTDAVATVAGRTGNVVLTKTDVGLANVDNTADSAKPVSTAQQTALNLKANLASPVFTGNVTGLGVATGTSFNSITGLASAAPLIAGTATVGISTLAARQDHIHPNDITKITKVTSTDNAIVRFDGTTGNVQNSGVIITDNDNLLVGTTTDNGIDKLQVDGSISATNLNGNANTATRFSTDRTNYMNSSDSAVAGELKWSANGNNHTIIDASSGVSPTGQAISNTHSVHAWIPSYPVLVGCDGSSTFGVKVDTARYAETAKELVQVATFPTADNQDFNTLMAGGVYNIIFGNYAGILNAPPANNMYGNMFVENGVNFLTQKYSSYAGELFHRTYYGGVWQPWKASVTVSDYSGTTNTVPRFDGGTGSLKNSNVAIDDSGNVGIGVTPSAWHSSIKAIEQGSRTSLFEFSGDTILNNNAYFTGSSWIRKTANACSMYEQRNGSHYWGITPSGTAGDAITWTNAMTLGSNGNLLVGTSTDNGVDKLQVNGGISASNIRSVGAVSGTSTINDFNGAGIETLGNGVSNTVFPTIGFHQPGHYASTIQLIGKGDFRFYSQGGTTYANVTANQFIGPLYGNANTATVLQNARTINGVSFNGSADIVVSDSTAVKLTENQTVAGVKTFTSSPIVPTPTTDFQAATKKYVDDSVGIKTIATGTATFTATTNNINLTGIGIGLEIGDVIQISGAIDAKNNSEFTVEVITDANNIIVNQAHANKGTTKNVALQAGDAGVTVKLLSKWYNAPLGLGQAWVNVDANRLASTYYINTTGRSIAVSIVANGLSASIGNSMAFNVGGISVYSSPAYSTTSSSIINNVVVSNGSTYALQTGGFTSINTIDFWRELR